MTSHQDIREFNDIKEFKLDANITFIHAGLNSFRIAMDETGDNARKLDGYFDDDTNDAGRWNLRFHFHPVFIVTVWAKDEQHAIKIANEKRIAALLAMKDGAPTT